MKKRLLLTVLVVLFCLRPSFAGVPAADEDVSARIGQLESETRALRSELQWLSERAVRLPGVEATPAATSGAATAPEVAEEELFTWEELQAEMKRLAWTKGDFKIVPYGFLWANMVYETERTNVGDYTLWVISAEDQGEDAFHVSARSTRLGLNVAGPRLWLFNWAGSGGKLEIDFHGAFTIENKPGVLLRHAYWEVKNENFRLLAGQTWDVLSPLLPGTIMYSVYWGGGNIGYRRPQFRAERYLALSETALLTLQGSLNTCGASDFAGGAPANGDHAGWPIIEARTAITLGHRGGYGRPITFGVSGHIGEQIFDFVGNDDQALRTWSCNVDLRAPVTDRLGFQGEFFTGENLKTFLGGIIQGVDIGREQTIRSTGGWLEIWYHWTPYLHSHLGYGIDDPEDIDVTSANGRIYNHAYWGNIVYDMTEKFTVGFEAGSWRTLFESKRPGEAVRFELMAKYGF